jgi:hypothetical protein
MPQWIATIPPHQKLRIEDGNVANMPQRKSEISLPNLKSPFLTISALIPCWTMPNAWIHKLTRSRTSNAWIHKLTWSRIPNAWIHKLTWSRIGRTRKREREEQEDVEASRALSKPWSLHTSHTQPSLSHPPQVEARCFFTIETMEIHTRRRS